MAGIPGFICYIRQIKTIMAKKKLYKTIVQVEILSEEPLGSMSLSDIDYHITDGHCSGQLSTVSEDVIEGTDAVEAVQKQGTDPEFFMMDKFGNEMDDDDYVYDDETEEEE